MKLDSTVDLSFKNPQGNTCINNPYTYHAESNMAFLKAVYNREIPMFSSAYSILANTFEQFYKGIYVELSKINKNTPSIGAGAFTKHMFDCFVKRIHMVIPVSKTREGYRQVVADATRIYDGYTKSKYYARYEYDDFAYDYQILMAQRDRLYRLLNAEREKFESKSKIAEIAGDACKTEDDLDLYR